MSYIPYVVYLCLYVIQISLCGHVLFLAVSTAQLFILQILQENGFKYPLEKRFVSREQLEMFLRLRVSYPLYSKLYTEKDFDVSATAKISMHQKFQKCFEFGMTTHPAVVSIIIYGAMLAFEILKRGMHGMCVLVPDWIDEYICHHVKPRLDENQWNIMKRNLHLDV